MQTPPDFLNIELTTATVTFLEMHQSPLEKLELLPDSTFKLIPKPISVETYRTYYYSVGEKFNWLDRMVMPDEELYQKINADNTDIFLMYVKDVPAGFAEFVKENDFTEILYFGLFPDFVGKGIGNYFLQWVIQQAWSYQPKWIQLNTCTLDHPNALPVYKKAGFVPIRTETQQRKIISDK
jgi:GNAT superfamily N-acetyltransferase